MAYNSNTSYRFVNPYNFVPLGTRCTREENDKSKNTFSGVIDYSLLTKTPLFIPNTSNEDAFDLKKSIEKHNSYDFFSYRDLSDMTGSVEDELPVPVIPGSEMRGMFRANYEILTNSCMSAVDDDKLLSKRTQDKYKAGLLERVSDNGGKAMYRLWNAEDCLLRTKGAGNPDREPDSDAWKADPENKKERKKIWGRKCYIQPDLPEGSEVGFYCWKRDKGKPLAFMEDMEGIDKEIKAKRRTGYIIKGEPGPEMGDGEKGFAKQNKHCAHIFVLKGNKSIKVNDQRCFSEDFLSRKLDAVLEIYEKNGKSKYTEYKERYEEFKKGRGNRYFPVYYSLITYDEPNGSGHHSNQMLMLSPACITREIYTRKMSDMAADHQPCSDPKNLCPACRLFGFLESNSGSGLASRIRVSDMECDEKDPEKCFDKEPITIQPLSTPKFNPEFYMKRPDKDAVFWTYEYYVDSEGKIHKNEAGINGRKFYWHHPSFSMEKCKAEPDKLNKTIRPLHADISFHGKIYFQNLTEKELNTLCYLISLGDEEKLEKKKCGYKLGSAKPLGFGSIALHLDQITLRSFGFDKEGRIAHVEKPYTPDMSNTLIDKDVKSNYKIVITFDYLSGKNVTYPRTKEGGHIYDWFAKNHTGYFKSNGKKVYNNMPQSRNYMLYEEYLSPMEPEVQRVYSREQAEETPQIGETVRGEVVGYNDKRTSAHVKVPGRDGNISIFFKNVNQETVGKAEYGKIHLLLTSGSDVQVTYGGKDRNGYDKWICNRVYPK